ncbi:HPr(Ser) kinase/phosphatase [Pajaroellobacter abortibovis]|uniref:HPr kinase/phosphorylase n=1 Tax=Pajaroellobacter abortibovis TaxID=1882918 RepID=A0A1L6MX96_9BACT|nr:HPr(Ser) kinase/phosphatase [Pajaroellobacter abortibovis]APS00122.1 HPr(Ser) kinase/phosphatase [Pajaroellobacter abortibovis]
MHLSEESRQFIPEVCVEALVRSPHLTVSLEQVAGAKGISRLLRHPRIQKSGLALTGHFFGVVPTRVQILGETELSYLHALDHTQRQTASRGFFSLKLSCVIITHNQKPLASLVENAEETNTPLFVSDSRSSRTINSIHEVLDELLAPRSMLHGVLMDVFGIGLLILGKSGIGKSECALELILRGHRLVADDVVQCEWHPPGTLFGSPSHTLRHHIEIRGLGVLNIKALFGVTSICKRKRIDLVVRLEEWNDRQEYERIGLEKKCFMFLGTKVPELTVPVRPGRDMGSILEMAARNELLRQAGTDSARDFFAKVNSHLGNYPIESEEEENVNFLHYHFSKQAQTSPPPSKKKSRENNVFSVTTESASWIPTAEPSVEGEDS